MEVRMNGAELELAFGDSSSSLVVMGDGVTIRHPAGLLGAKDIEVGTECGTWRGAVRSVSIAGEKAALSLWAPVYTGAVKAYISHTTTDSGCAILAIPERIYKVAGSSGEAGSLEEYVELRSEAPGAEELSDATDVRLKDLDVVIEAGVAEWRSSDASDVSRHIAGRLWIVDEWSTFQHRWDWSKYGQAMVSNLLNANGVESDQMILEALAAKIIWPEVTWLELKVFYGISQEDISSFL